MLTPVAANPDASPSTWRSFREVTGSWRLLSVALLSFSSGFPLGLVWFAIPTWMKQEGVDIKVVGLFTLAQAPWSFKFLWSPLMDRYVPPFLGRKRGWILVSQAALVGFGMCLAVVSDRAVQGIGLIGALTLAIAFASATQDIAYDGYSVEVLRKEEHGVAVGARVALYRTAMQVSGGVAITLAAETSWQLVNFLLALCYLPLMLITRRAPDPEGVAEPPRTLRQAVWEPFVGFLRQHRSLEILAFVVLYKLSDNLTQSLTRPFFVEVGFGPWDVGIGTATVGQLAAILGTIAGGVLTQRMGLGRALWVFGFLQIGSNLGYAVVAQAGVNRPLLYAAHSVEYVTTGLGSGAFGVLLLRLTEKRFSATQYALLSSLFSIPRVLSGPPVGVLAAALGWRDFYILTVFAGIPGLLMLRRFAPWGARHVELQVEAPAQGRPLRRSSVALRAALAGVVCASCSLLILAGLEAVKRTKEGTSFVLASYLGSLLKPASEGEWLTALGVWLLGLMGATATAAALVARRGLAAAGGSGNGMPGQGPA